MNILCRMTRVELQPRVATHTLCKVGAFRKYAPGLHHRVTLGNQTDQIPDVYLRWLAQSGEQAAYARPTSFIDTSHRREPLASSLASSLSWFSNEPLVFEKLQYTPLFFRSGLATTCKSK